MEKLDYRIYLIKRRPQINAAAEITTLPSNRRLISSVARILKEKPYEFFRYEFFRYELVRGIPEANGLPGYCHHMMSQIVRCVHQYGKYCSLEKVSHP